MTMRVIPLATVNDTVMVSSNVPEADYAVWSNVTAYTAGQRVIMTTGVHQIFEALTGSTGVNPSTDIHATVPKWLLVGATNRWAAFDAYLESVTSQATMIEYELSPLNSLNALALMGLSATSVEVRITDSLGTVVYNQTFTTTQTVAVNSFSYSFSQSWADGELVLSGLPFAVGCTMRIRINASGTASVGLIVIGREVILGESLTEPVISIEDYSRKERDEFGRVDIVKRSFSAQGEFSFAIPAGDVARVARNLTSLRARAAVWHCGEGTGRLGTTIYGYPSDWSIPVRMTAHSIASLEIEGLV